METESESTLNTTNLIEESNHAMNFLAKRLVLKGVISADCFSNCNFINIWETPSKKNFCHGRGAESSPPSNSEEKTISDLMRDKLIKGLYL